MAQETCRSEGIVTEERTASRGSRKKLAQVEKKLALSDSQCASLQQDFEGEIFETAESSKDVSFKLTDSNEYDADFELCLMYVLSKTSYSKAWPIVKTVFFALTGKTIMDEPSRAYLQAIMRRADVLTEIQIALAVTDATILTASLDNTRKKGRILGGAQITVGDVSKRTHRVYSLGVDEVADGQQ